MSTCNKIPYRTEAQAMKAAREIQSAGKSSRLRPYLCRHCRVYHLTSQAPQGVLSIRNLQAREDEDLADAMQRAIAFAAQHNCRVRLWHHDNFVVVEKGAHAAKALGKLMLRVTKPD